MVGQPVSPCFDLCLKSFPFNPLLKPPIMSPPYNFQQTNAILKIIFGFMKQWWWVVITVIWSLMICDGSLLFYKMCCYLILLVSILTSCPRKYSQEWMARLFCSNRSLFCIFSNKTIFPFLILPYLTFLIFHILFHRRISSSIGLMWSAIVIIDGVFMLFV